MPRDTTAPIANVTSPVNGSQVTTATITITGTGTDAVGVTNLRLFVGTTQVATANFTAGKNVLRTLSTSYVLPAVGNYTIRCEARDAAGNVGTRSITVTYASVITTTSSTTTIAPPPVLPVSKTLITPAAWNQGGEGACCCMSAALVRSIEQYYTTGATSYSQSTNELSPEWLYNIQLCGYTTPMTTSAFTTNCQLCGYGSGTLGVFGTIRNIGVSRWSVCPYSFQNSCKTDWFTQAMIDDAVNYKITHYAMVNTTDIYSMKRLINNNHALHITFQNDSNCYYSTCGYIWNSRGTLMASHAMAIVGYDDTKQAWLAQNSWGPNWGCNGQIWIDYNFLTTLTLGAYWMTTRVDKNPYPIL